MKNKMKMVCLFVGLIIIMVACSNDDQAPENEPLENEEDAQHEQPQDDQTEETNEEENEEENKENEGTEDESADGTNEEQPEEVPQEGEELEPQYEMTDVWSFKPIDDANPNVVLLTFDDAPDEHALEIAKTLKEKDIPAIFFVNGIFIESEEKQQIVKNIHDMGFEIGNHTYGHTKLDDVSQEKQREEILSLNELIEEITGEKPKFFRAPHGVNTDYAKQLVRDEGMLLMNWSYGYDFMEGYLEKEALADIMVNTPYLSNGANLLMHDREWTYQALPDIIEGLKEQGYEFLDPDLIKISEN
ncbi:polysaccharide deacetylase family protein [Tenuibacillus multivorans]|uniref:Peptidoglycan/xylan/chitin deacetylase, PgdA/CDA1 family n=1 Tax=Tenuibacillus multivorans TaxID=237069 RepID=A0A1G9YBR6_9BACI|nr:polysaccharide deacetylase family protein [Tenuibacillus multivorans]GEL76030.1 hypothetical protein TMU01_02650 [Tenuibacillus multivorans]SDN06457.1 Peptidoglycan/xylan/chitin deacetylase, PgdA/CDA1 family [Tenuibacillus multivorans]